MTKREQALLDYLHSPAVHIYSEEERRENWCGEPSKFPARTPEETEAILAKLAKAGARSTWCRTVQPEEDRSNEIRWDLLAKGLDAKWGTP